METSFRNTSFDVKIQCEIFLGFRVYCPIECTKASEGGKRFFTFASSMFAPRNKLKLGVPMLVLCEPDETIPNPIQKLFIEFTTP